MYFEDQNLCKYQVVPRNILFSYQIGQQWEPSGQILSSHNSSFCKVKKSKGTLNAHVCIYGCLSSVFFPSKKSKRTLFLFMFLCLRYFCFQKIKGTYIECLWSLVYLYLCRTNLETLKHLLLWIFWKVRFFCGTWQCCVCLSLSSAWSSDCFQLFSYDWNWKSNSLSVTDE